MAGLSDLPQLEQLINQFSGRLGDLARSAPTDEMRRQAGELAEQITTSHADLVSGMKATDGIVEQAVEKAKGLATKARKEAAGVADKKRKKEAEFAAKQAKRAEKRKNKKKEVKEVDPELGLLLRDRLLARVGRPDRRASRAGDTGDFADWLRE